MPIVDYAKLAKRTEKKVLQDKYISEVNKKNLKKFLLCYDVSSARYALFLKHIALLLKESEDIKKDMHNRDKINLIFKKFRTNLSTPYYATIINVSLRFLRWLNDGEKPKGVLDLKNVSKLKQKRDLKAEDMVSWEDGLKMGSNSNSIQIKAVVMTQLDGGFRPSEFIDLKFGDIKIKKNFAIAMVDGKTGKRDVILFKSVPFLNKWLNNHLTKERNDPLWIMETPKKNNKKLRVCPYNYPALQKRIKDLGKKSNINKPLDFYNLRHSACTISKLENVNSGLAAEKFGHSVEYYEKTYGRLDSTGKIKRFERVYGLESSNDKDNKNMPKLCSRCNYNNESKVDYCENCQSPLTMDTALNSFDETKNMKNRLEMIENFMKSFKHIPNDEIIKEVNKRQS
jgi:integrase